MTEERAVTAVDKLKALADEKRLTMIRLLKSDLCVGALAQKLSISDAAASQHLKILREANLVKGEKRGYWTHYFLVEEELEKLAEEIRELLTADPLETCVCDCEEPKGSGNCTARFTNRAEPHESPV